MSYYINPVFGYYEGDKIENDEEVSQRPSPLHKWVNGAWQIDPVAVSASIQAQIDKIEMESLMNRGAREMAMRQIEERAQLDATSEKTANQILATQPFYAKLKQIDDQVSALRIQL